MSAKDASSQNTWFGVSMFLIGVISGAVLAFASGTNVFSGDSGATPKAPQAPTAPQVSVEERMTAYAKEAGADETKFKECVAANVYTTTQPFTCTSGEFCDKINKQMAEGQQGGVSGTPGNILVDMKTGKARLISGAQPIANFKKNIDEMLKNPNTAITDPSTKEASNVTPVDPENDQIRGSKTATLALIEYSDYECPFCHRVHPTYLQLLDEYEGKIMWVYRHYPLNFHPEALPLAIGAECVSKLAGQDAYWQFTDKVMSE